MPRTWRKLSETLLDMEGPIGQRYVPYFNVSLSVYAYYRPSCGKDVYEFIQRRSDWKKIEKTVDKTMYNLSFKEDCIIS